jgi:hypothetical protein
MAEVVLVKEKRAVLWLRLAFILGAVTDAAAVIPMVSPGAAADFWGLEAVPDSFRFAMLYGAALMAGWTLFLVWASFRPLERRMAAPLTVLVVVGLIAAEIVAIQSGVLTFGRALASLIIQALILALYSFAYVVSRPKNLRA